MNGDDYYRATDAAAAFMRARLDELEAAAKRVNSIWRADEPGTGVVFVGGEPLIEAHIGGLAERIELNQPSAVLDSITADRALLDAYDQACNIAQGDPTDTAYIDGIAHAIRCRVSAWNRHPGYLAEWKL